MKRKWFVERVWLCGDMPREVGKKGIMMNSIGSEMNVGNDTLQHVRKACKRSIENRERERGTRRRRNGSRAANQKACKATNRETTHHRTALVQVDFVALQSGFLCRFIGVLYVTMTRIHITRMSVPKLRNAERAK